MGKCKEMVEKIITKRNAKKFGRCVEDQTYRDGVVKLLREGKESGKSEEELAKILSDEQGKIEYAEAYTATGRKMNNEMARKLIESGNREYVKKNLTKFKSIDDDVLIMLWMKGREAYFKKSIDLIKEEDSCSFDDEIFSYVTPHELANLWTYTTNEWTEPYGQIDVLAYSFGSFPGLDPLEYAKKFEAQVGRKYYYTIASTRRLENPIFDLIRHCKTITPEFEKYIISLGRAFEKVLEERRSSGKSDGIEDEGGKFVNVSKEDLVVAFVKKCRDIVGKPEKDKGEIVGDDAGLDGFLCQIARESGLEVDKLKEMLRSLGCID